MYAFIQLEFNYHMDGYNAGILFHILLALWSNHLWRLSLKIFWTFLTLVTIKILYMMEKSCGLCFQYMYSKIDSFSFDCLNS